MDVNPDTLNMELIWRVGPAGQFLTTMDTVEKCRSHSWNPLIGVGGKTGGSPSDKFLKSIVRRQQAMLDNYSTPSMHRGLLAELDDCMVQGVDRLLLSTICSQTRGNSNPCDTSNRRTS